MYNPVSVLPTVLKVHEKLMQKELKNYITKFLSSFFMWLQESVQ